MRAATPLAVARIGGSQPPAGMRIGSACRAAATAGPRERRVRSRIVAEVAAAIDAGDPPARQETPGGSP
jgi:hypothetical protein